MQYPPQGQQQQQGPPEPYTKADDLQAQRLQQGMSLARQELNDGNLDQQEFQQMMGMLQQQLAPLTQRQQQQQEQQEQQQEQQQRKQHAMMTAIENEAAKFRAQSLPDQIVPVYDVATGRTARLYPSAPGRWSELKFEDAHLEEAKNGPRPGDE